MRIYLIAALVGTLALFAFNSLLQRLDAEKAVSVQLAKDLKESKQETKDAEALALEIENNLNLERGLQTTLQLQHSKISSQLNSRNLLVEKLKRENKELSDWAANGLPDAVKWLRERPAITSAQNYQDWLSSRDGLHPDSYEPAEQR